MKHMTKTEIRWAYDRWCEGYTYHQIAEALDVTLPQVERALLRLPRIRPILHYTPQEQRNDAKQIILNMATAIINSQLKGEQGHQAFSEEQISRYGRDNLNAAVALFNAGWRR